MISKPTIPELEKRALKIRLSLLEMFTTEKANHFGGCLSCVEILTALYFYKMNYCSANSNDPARDRFILSKGHSVPTQYVILAMLGIIGNQELATLKSLGSRLQGHPDILKTTGLEAPTGSLGQGLSFANGIALAARLDCLKFNIYVVLGDGELQEGQVWEAAMTTSHHGLSNICAIVDRNRYQSQGCVDDIKGVENIEQKFEAFGWRTARVDGHDLGKICAVLDATDTASSRPYLIVADTVKGKGVAFLENTYKYHNYQITAEQRSKAILEIQQQLESVERA